MTRHVRDYLRANFAMILNQDQIRETVSLDLKRASRYLYLGLEEKAQYFIVEARKLVKECDLTAFAPKKRKYLDFSRKTEESVVETAEKWLLAATILSIKPHKLA